MVPQGTGHGEWGQVVPGGRPRSYNVKAGDPQRVLGECGAVHTKDMLLDLIRLEASTAPWVLCAKRVLCFGVCHGAYLSAFAWPSIVCVNRLLSSLTDKEML